MRAVSCRLLGLLYVQCLHMPLSFTPVLWYPRSTCYLDQHL